MDTVTDPGGIGQLTSETADCPACHTHGISLAWTNETDGRTEQAFLCGECRWGRLIGVCVDSPVDDMEQIALEKRSQRFPDTFQAGPVAAYLRDPHVTGKFRVVQRKATEIEISSPGGISDDLLEILEDLFDGSIVTTKTTDSHLTLFVSEETVGGDLQPVSITNSTRQ